MTSNSLVNRFVLREPDDSRVNHRPPAIGAGHVVYQFSSAVLCESRYVRRSHDGYPHPERILVQRVVPIPRFAEFALIVCGQSSTESAKIHVVDVRLNTSYSGARRWPQFSG